MQLKRFAAVLPALALSTAMVFAQEPQPTPTQSQTPQTSVGQPTDTNEPVFKGCISGTKDNYVLTTSDGKSFRLHSDKDIAEHVGKMVEIRGTIKKEGADRPADAAPAAQVSEMDVADVKNVEGSCPSDNTGAAAVNNDATNTEANTQAAATEPAKTDEQKATVTEQPANSAAASTETPAASASASTDTTSQPAASASVSTDTTSQPAASASASTSTEPAASAAVSTDTQPSASASVSTDQSANQATDTTATAPAATEQNAQSDSAQLPETASPLPLLGLLGFGATGLGLLMRRK